MLFANKKKNPQWEGNWLWEEQQMIVRSYEEHVRNKASKSHAVKDQWAGAGRTTRAGQDTKRLAVPRAQRKTLAARSFSVTGPVTWNRLPGDLRAVDSLETFKKRPKAHLFSKFWHKAYLLTF